MTPREQVLSTVRRSLGVTGQEAPRLAAIAARFAAHAPGVVPDRATGKSDAERLRLFVEMAEASAATVDVVPSSADVPGAIAAFLRERNLASAVRRGDDARLADLPWAATALEVTVGRSFGDDETGVSAAFAAVAETGTLAVVSGPGNPTTLNFLPENHVVVLDARDVLATYEDLWTQVRARYGAGIMPRTVNWITGPSRSADIEQILLMGAHGPRRLHIVLIDPSAAAEAAGDAAEPAGSTPSPAIVRSTLGGEKGGGAPDTPPPAPRDPKPAEPETEDDELDDELDDSFPASDPPSKTQP